MKIAIPGVLILIGVVGLIAMGISQGAIPEVNVESLQNGDYDGQQVRLLGVIHKIETDTRPMRFEIRGMQDPSVVVMAQVDDQRPDLFKVDTDVAVIGAYNADTKSFKGTKIFTKCPSKYEATDQLGKGSEAARRGESYESYDSYDDPSAANSETPSSTTESNSAPE